MGGFAVFQHSYCWRCCGIFYVTGEATRYGYSCVHVWTLVRNVYDCSLTIIAGQYFLLGWKFSCHILLFFYIKDIIVVVIIRDYNCGTCLISIIDEGARMTLRKWAGKVLSQWYWFGKVIVALRRCIDNTLSQLYNSAI